MSHMSGDKTVRGTGHKPVSEEFFEKRTKP